MPQTYRVTAYVTQRVETLVYTDDEDEISELAIINIQLELGDYKVISEEIDILEYDLIHDANID